MPLTRSEHLMAAAPVGPPVTGLTSVEVDGCFHIYNPASHNVVALNDTASNVWRLCTGEYEIQEIVASLAEHYAVGPDAIEAQVRDVIGDLAMQGLLDAPNYDSPELR